MIQHLFTALERARASTSEELEAKLKTDYENRELLRLIAYRHNQTTIMGDRGLCGQIGVDYVNPEKDQDLINRVAYQLALEKITL